MKYILMFGVWIFFGCNLDVNTADPQASKNISFSKRNHLFIKEYVLDSASISIFSPESAWIEHTWKNKRDRSIDTIGSTHLVLRFKHPEEINNKYGNYTSGWIMYAVGQNYLGSVNGVYDLSLEEVILPDKFVIFVNSLDSMRHQSQIAKIVLSKKKVGGFAVLEKR